MAHHSINKEFFLNGNINDSKILQDNAHIETFILAHSDNKCDDEVRKEWTTATITPTTTKAHYDSFKESKLNNANVSKNENVNVNAYENEKMKSNTATCNEKHSNIKDRIRMGMGIETDAGTDSWNRHLEKSLSVDKSLPFLSLPLASIQLTSYVPTTIKAIQSNNNSNSYNSNNINNTKNIGHSLPHIYTYTSSNGAPPGFYRNTLSSLYSLHNTLTMPIATTTTTIQTKSPPLLQLPSSTSLLSSKITQQQQSEQLPERQQRQQQQEQMQNDTFKLFTIYGNDSDNEKSSVLAHSTTGSLSSIITTSVTSSEPDPGTDSVKSSGLGGAGSAAAAAGGGGGGGGDGSGSGSDGNSTSGSFGGNGNSSGRFIGSRQHISNTTSTSAINDEKQALNRPGIKQEKWSSILFQVSIPFFLAGIGTIGAGIILGKVEKWQVFKIITELFILVPALLGLKGNLDMCLASRLSTQVNLGNMNSRTEVISMITGNIALVQVQATIASFLVALFAITVGAVMDGNFQFEHVMLLIASSMFTATSSCFVLDFVLVAVILLSQKFHLNPDNLATPLAASLGDVVSISLLSLIASVLFDNIKTHLWITYAVVICYVFLLPVWIFMVLKNTYTRPVLKSGWVPVLSALCISGVGGLVLDAAVEVFQGFVVFQPIINGIGGNLVSVQASKISTMLHQSSIIGIIPPHTKIFEWPWKTLFKGVPYAKTARILIFMSIPGNILFIYVADYIHMSRSTIKLSFIIAYLVASLLQVMLLLYIAHIVVHTMWKWKIDPDNSTIPYLTALGDLLGSSLLALAFLFLLCIHQEYGDDTGNQATHSSN